MELRAGNWVQGRILVATCNPTFSECCLKSTIILDFVCKSPVCQMQPLDKKYSPLSKKTNKHCLKTTIENKQLER